MQRKQHKQHDNKAGSAGRGNRGSTQTDGPSLPHEKDQTTDAQNPAEQGGENRKLMKQAKDDIVSGKKDTDLHGTPGLDKPTK
jgi:hypothetical protein